MVAWAKFIFPAAGPVIDAGGDNAIDTTPTTQTINQWTARIDEKIGQNDSAWFRYSRDTAVTSSSGGVPGIQNVVQVPNRNYGGSYVHVFSPSLVLQASFGRTIAGDNAIDLFSKSTASVISQIGFSPAFVGNFSAAPGKNFLPSPGIGGGYANPGESVALHPDVPNSNQYSGSLTKTFGRHVIDVGGGFITLKFFAPITTDAVSFQAAPTGNTDPNDTRNTGDALSSFLLNVPGQADRRNEVTETRPGGVMSGYVQDSWRATSKLTINAGLRYDITFNPPNGPNSLIGVNGGPESGNADFNNGTYVVQKLPPLCSVRGRAPCIPDGGPGPGELPANVVVSPNDKLMKNTYDNVGPHFGFALKVTDRTVVHSAFGIVYDNWAGVQQLAQNISGLWPDTGQQEAPGLNKPSASSPTPAVKAQNPFAVSTGNTFFPAPTPFTQAGFGYDPDIRNPYSEQWNFGVQQVLSSSTTVTVNYVGASSHRLDVGGVYNTAVTPSASNTPNAIGAYDGALYPYMVPSYYDRSAGKGNYHGLQASVDRRYSNGLSYGVAYTFSKSINVGGDGYFGVEGGVPQDPYNPARYDRSVAGLDLKHILTGNVLYDIPVGKGKSFSTKNSALDYILGNWQFNNLFQSHSGSPFTPIISSDQANTGNAGWMGYEHLNVVGNPKLSNRTAAKWFNTAAYATPTLGTYGNAGRNSLRGPGFWNLDTSLFRLFPIGEGRQFEFRAEAFNILNHVNLGQPNNDINSGKTFGTINGVSNPARQIQLSGKFVF